MNQRLLFLSLFLCSFILCPSASLSTRKTYSLSVLNHETARSKMLIKVFSKKDKILTTSVSLGKIPATGSAKSRSTSEVASLEAECSKRDKECSRLLENDINVISVSAGKQLLYRFEKYYYCKQERSSAYGYYFVPCFKSSSYKPPSRGHSGDDYVHIVYIDGAYVLSPSFLIRLVKTDNTELKIHQYGSQSQKIFDAKGTSAEIGEILLDSSLKLSEDTFVFVFVEGSEKVVFRRDKSYSSADNFVRYLPINKADKYLINRSPKDRDKVVALPSVTGLVINFRTDRDSTRSDFSEAEKKLTDACSSEGEMGSLFVNIQKTNFITYKLPLKDICRKANPILTIKTDYTLFVSFVEASCDKSSGACYELLKDDLHVMVILYPRIYAVSNADNYLCKREKLPSGKYLYARCGEQLSTAAKEQKREDEYVHLIYLQSGNTYIKLGQTIKIVKVDKKEHFIKRETRDRRVYQFIGSTSPIDYILIDTEGAEAATVKIAVLKEGSGTTLYCLDLKEKKLENKSKFIEC